MTGAVLCALAAAVGAACSAWWVRRGAGRAVAFERERRAREMRRAEFERAMAERAHQNERAQAAAEAAVVAEAVRIVDAALAGHGSAGGER